MTTVLCDERNCIRNHNGVCRAEAIHIVEYKDAWDCTQFRRTWSQPRYKEVEHAAIRTSSETE